MFKLNRRVFAAASVALARAGDGTGTRTGQGPALRAERQPDDPRSDLDDRLRHARPRLHDLRHAVRDRREQRRASRRWSTSTRSRPTRLLWTFTLRDGLEWHDGKPVTAEDCVASLKRWGARDPMGQKLMDFVAELKPVNDKTFTLKLKEPYGLVLDTLGKPSSNVPFMMPKRIADTDPFKQIDSQIGSGPFIYVNAESKPGEKHVYIKNPKYKPRRRARLRPGRRQDRQGRPGRVRRHVRPDAAGERADRRRDRHDRAGAARPHSALEEGQGRADRRTGTRSASSSSCA